MASISPAQVKELREKTGAPMMDCKKALGETDGDIEAAVDWLRKKGLQLADKKSGRAATEGLVTAATRGTVGALVEVNAETDFVARNEQFQALVKGLGEMALDGDGTFDGLKSGTYPATGKSVEDELTSLIATIGENMKLRRVAKLSVCDGVVASYIHASLAPGLGTIGVLVALESTGDKAKLADLGKDLAMHVAAAKPMALTTDKVDASAIERERNVLSEQARASGKPENVIEKMVEGRLRKFYEENVLVEQVFVKDTDRKVKKVLEDAAADVGAPVAIADFIRFTLGEGLEKEESDFAAEVAKTLGS